MSKMQRRKGADFERDVARDLRKLLGDESVRRGCQARDGCDAPDVICKYLWVECKHQIKPNIAAAVRQMVAACLNPTLWRVAITKANGEKPLVTMPYEDFLDMFKELVELKEM